jgi:hypothetical protein
MDRHGFDDLLRGLAIGVSRRSVLGGLIGGFLGGLSGRAAAANRGQERVVLCHHHPGGARTMTVAVPALAAHLAHGDTVGPCEAFCPPSQLCGTGAEPECCLDTNTACCGGVCCDLNGGEDCCVGQFGHTCCPVGRECCGGACCPEGEGCWQGLCLPAGIIPCGETFCDRNAGECCAAGVCATGELCFG